MSLVVTHLSKYWPQIPIGLLVGSHYVITEYVPCPALDRGRRSFSQQQHHSPQLWPRVVIWSPATAPGQSAYHAVTSAPYGDPSPTSSYPPVHSHLDHLPPRLAQSLSAPLPGDSPLCLSCGSNFIKWIHSQWLCIFDDCVMCALQTCLCCSIRFTCQCNRGSCIVCQGHSGYLAWFVRKISPTTYLDPSCTKAVVA